MTTSSLELKSIQPDTATPVAHSQIDLTIVAAPAADLNRSVGDHVSDRAPLVEQEVAESPIDEILNEVQLFRSQGIAYVTVPTAGHQENWPVKSEWFNHWIRARHLRKTRGAIAPQSLKNIIDTLVAKALIEDYPELPVSTRIGHFDGKVYVDLANPNWEVLEISESGRHMIADSPVKFMRSTIMLPQPMPVAGGSINELRPFLNVADDDWPLVVGWLVGTFLPIGEFPFIAITGSQGSGKSTMSKSLKQLIDPDQVPIINYVSQNDMLIAAKKTWVLAFDNISRIKPEDSDALCRLSSGTASRARMLYTDDEERIIAARRPVILNGIGDIITRGDLLERTIVIEAPTITADRRVGLGTFASFEEALPRILGALYDGVSHALRTRGTVQVANLPRLADATLWITAAEPGLGIPAGTFHRALDGNRQRANGIVLEGSPLAEALRAHLQLFGTFQGTATKLLQDLEAEVSGRKGTRTGLPRTAQALGTELKRLEPNLRAEGIEIVPGRSAGNSSQRTLTISMVSGSTVATVAPCQSAPFQVIAATAEVVAALPEPASAVTTLETVETQATAQSDGCDGTSSKSYMDDLGD